MAVEPLFNINKDGKPDSSALIAERVKLWRENQNYSPIFLGAVSLAMGNPDPLMTYLFANNPHLQDDIAAFADGDVGALDKPDDMVLTVTISSSSTPKWFK